jgi:glucose-fructose oxidoreductase
VRYAVVGLGHIAQAAVLPAFEHAGENSRLVALVSDDPVKLKALGRRYGVKALYSYDRYRELLRAGIVDAVYIAVPNAKHAEFAVPALEAGIHVLCEKPLAAGEDDCRRMLDAAARGGARLMTAYRLHFEDANMEAVRLARSGKIGAPRYMISAFSQQVRPGDVRLRRGLGGGSVWDMGIYCINAARYLFGSEPEEVCAFTTGGMDSDARFKEVDEMCSATLRFPGGRLASFTCSFGAADVSSYRLVGTLGEVRCEPAYEYVGDLKLTVTAAGKTKERTFPSRDQFAPELVYFSDCVLAREEPEPSGVEGLADVRVIEALYRSAREGRPIRLGTFEKTRRPGPELEMRRPAVKEPPLVRSEPPSLESDEMSNTTMTQGQKSNW